MPRAPFGLSIEERFWTKVDKRPDGCWLWTDVPANTGYGTFSVRNRSVLAHRFAYELLIGQIPTGLTLDHLCRVRHCVNPAHLDPVPFVVNKARACWQTNGLPMADYCRRGHRYCEVGKYVRPDNGSTTCYQCALDRSRASTHREEQRRQAAEAAGPDALRKYLNRRQAQLARWAKSA